MESNQATTTLSNAPLPRRGIFGTSIPSLVAFAIGILLFVMPFAQCKYEKKASAKNEGGFNISFESSEAVKITKSGLDLALGKPWKVKVGSLGGLTSESDINSFTKSMGKPKPNPLAIAALALGVIGLILSFSKAASSAIMAAVCGFLAAATLIVLMFDIQKQTKLPKIGSGDLGGWFGNMADYSGKTVVTPWLYVAVAAFLAAAFFCYKRMQTKP